TGALSARHGPVRFALSREIAWRARSNGRRGDGTSQLERGRQPGRGCAMAGLVRGDLGLVAEREADIVLAAQQHLFAERIDLEAMDRATGRRRRVALLLYR